MKAAVLNAFGEPLAIQTLPDPVLGTGEVIVDVAAAGVTSYAANVFNGSRNYLLEPPVVPGAGRRRPGARRPARTRPSSRSATGSLRLDDPLAGQCRRSRHDPARLDLPDRSGPAAAPLLPPRLLRRADAGSDRERHADRRHRRGGRWPLDRARPAPGAVRRPAGGRTEGRRDAGGERRHRRLRRRRGRGRPGDGRRAGGGHRAATDARWTTWSAASDPACGRRRFTGAEADDRR